jgi:hypothetical protein
MAMPRLTGGRSLTRTSEMMMSPDVVSSSPAIIRNNVDFPQPDGPTNTTNSRSSTSRSTPLITSVSAKDFCRRERVSWLTGCLFG